MQHTRETFDWADPFRLAEQLTDEERMVQDTAQRLCAGKARSPGARCLPQ